MGADKGTHSAAPSELGRLKTENEALKRRVSAFERDLVKVSNGTYKGRDVLKIQVGGGKPLFLGKFRAWAILRVVDELRGFVGEYVPRASQVDAIEGKESRPKETA